MNERDMIAINTLSRMSIILSAGMRCDPKKSLFPRIEDRGTPAIVFSKDILWAASALFVDPVFVREVVEDVLSDVGHILNVSLNGSTLSCYVSMVPGLIDFIEGEIVRYATRR